MTSRIPSAESLKGWFWTAFLAGLLLQMANDLLSVDGVVWSVVRWAAFIAMVALLLGWVTAWVRETSMRRGWRPLAEGWGPPLVLAVAVLAALALAGVLIDDALAGG